MSTADLVWERIFRIEPDRLIVIGDGPIEIAFGFPRHAAASVTHKIVPF
jgi:hypothetical protein